MRLTHRDVYGRWFSDGSKASLRLGNPSENYPAILWGDAVNKLAAYEEAEEQGRLVRLPCRVGDTVYFLQRCLDSYTFVNCGDIIAFHVYSSYVTVEVNDRVASHPFVTLDVSAFGKTVFLTHEEAAAALNGGQDDV